MFKLVKKYIKLPNEILYIMIEKGEKKTIYLNIKRKNEIKEKRSAE